MYYLHKDYEQALVYCKEAEFMMTQHEFKDEARIYGLFGIIYTAMGDFNTALFYLKKAIEYRNSSQTSSVVGALQATGELYMLKGGYLEALKNLKEALQLTESEHNPTHREKIMKSLSESYEALADYKEALRWERTYQAEKDSLFSLERERSINEIRLLYDLQRHENQISQQQIELLQKSKKELWLFGVILFIFLLLVYVFYTFTRKNRFYKMIVQQHKDAVSREKILQKQIQKLRDEQSQSSTTDKYASSSLTEEKKSDLFIALEQLMQEQKIYTDNLLTKEKVAILLNTNRTYLSQAINEQTGQTFTQYINKYRINEAVRILSDPQNDMPLKAIAADLGFNSKTTFYKLFQEVVGMTPAQYKNKV